MNSYKFSMVTQAQSLSQAGLSQGQIGEALGMCHQTISNWLKVDLEEARKQIIGKRPIGANNLLSTRRPGRYLVVGAAVEKFRPPEGVGPFSLVIADPPWNVSDVGHSRERTARPKRAFTKDFGAWDAFPSERAYLAQCREWLKALYDLAAPDAFLFFWCSYRYMSHILVQAQGVGWQEKTAFLWGKTNPMPMFGNNNLLASFESALVLAKGGPIFQFNGKAPRNWFISPQVGGLERVKDHNGGAANLAQKPLDLTKQWVLWGSKRGDWVLDAFAGTGTVTVAGLHLGRNACAVEADSALAHQIEARVLRECPGAVSYG